MPAGRSIGVTAWGLALVMATCSSDPPGNDRPSAPAAAAGSPPGTSIQSSARPDAAGGGSPTLQRAFAVTSDFAPMPTPQPGDWLWGHEEERQTLARWRANDPNLPTPARDTIVLVVLGGLAPEAGPTEAELVDHARRYFGMEVRAMPEIASRLGDVRTRSTDTGRQLNASDLLDGLEPLVPDDAYCVLALTQADLYPSDDYNYVFGLARLHARVGVFSFARYHPSFFDPDATAPRERVLRRALKIMSHEIGHMFGIGHCVMHRCAMNGNNHLDELDAMPLHLCPVCLSKLHEAVGFDPQTRYRTLADGYEGLGLVDEQHWAQRRADFVVGP